MVAVPRRGLRRPPGSRVLPGARSNHGAVCKPSPRPPRSARPAPGASQGFCEGTGKHKHVLASDAEKAADYFPAKCPDSPVEAKPPLCPVTWFPFCRVTDTPKRLGWLHSDPQCVPSPAAAATRPGPSAQGPTDPRVGACERR